MGHRAVKLAGNVSRIKNCRVKYCELHLTSKSETKVESETLIKVEFLIKIEK